MNKRKELSVLCFALLSALTSIVCVFSGSWSLLALSSEVPSPSTGGIECKSLNIRLLAPRSPGLERYVEILTSRIGERTGIKPTFNRKAGCSVELDVHEGIGTEGFRIEDVSGGSVRIIGNDDRGLLYGIGKFLRSNTYLQGSFTLGNWRGTSVPRDPVRGIYFATHFHNFYNDAPIEGVRRYVEDLSLWGVNAFSVAYDMHMYAGMEDPAAEAMLKRLHALFEEARGLGMSTGLMLGANSSYNNSPKELRAEGPGRGAFDETNLCPYMPGAKALLLKQLSQEFEAFKDVGVDYVTIWPYDAAGCSCMMCRPWGSNGFLYIAEPESRLARRYFPSVRVTLPTWYFDPIEWEGLVRVFRQKPDWVDYLLAEPIGDAGAYILHHPVPGNLPLMGFPEISMAGMFPWGGFGANPQPARFQKEWNLVKDRFQGGFPYCEGIYEDLNEVIFAQFYWNPDRDAYDTVREYLAYEFSPSVVTEMTKVVKILDHNLHYRWWPGAPADYPANFPGVGPSSNPGKWGLAQKDVGAEEAFDIVRQVQTKLSPYAQKSWRWRIIYLRALLDHDMDQNERHPTERAKEAFRELTDIYHAAHADGPVKPPFQ